jgi:hypothetical protein
MLSVSSSLANVSVALESDADDAFCSSAEAQRYACMVNVAISWHVDSLRHSFGDNTRSLMGLIYYNGCKIFANTL